MRVRPRHPLHPGVSLKRMIRSAVMYTLRRFGPAGVEGAASPSGGKGTSFKSIAKSVDRSPSSRAVPSLRAFSLATAMGKRGGPSSTQSSDSGTSTTRALPPSAVLLIVEYPGNVPVSATGVYAPAHGQTWSHIGLQGSSGSRLLAEVTQLPKAQPPAVERRPSERFPLGLLRVGERLAVCAEGQTRIRV